MSYGRKIRLNQLPCRASPDKYVWVVSKGCFEKHTNTASNPTVKPTVKPTAVNDDDLKCNWLGCIKREGRDQKGIDIMVFPKDHYLFRSATSETFYSPSWYSDEEVARLYYDEGLSKCKRFIAKRAIRLINLGDTETIKVMLREPSLTEKERYAIFYVSGVNAPEEIKQKRNKKDLAGKGKYMVFSPTGFLFEEDFAKREYANIKFAKAVCKFGYDGWLIPRNTIIDGTSGHFFLEEVMLCNPASVLTPTGIGCLNTN
jgi:hypothetical protein